jgi:predicted HTH domain antitoxin
MCTSSYNVNMTSTISVRLEKPTLHVLTQVEKEWHTDRSEVIRRLLDKALKEWKIENALEKIREQKLSVGKAAETCGLPLWVMLDLVRQRSIDWTGYSQKDLEKDLALLD